MYLRKIFLVFLYFIFFHIGFFKLLSQPLPNYENSEEIDQEIRKYISKLKENDTDEQFINHIFGPPLKLKEQDLKTKDQENTVQFQNITDKELNEKLTEFYNQSLRDVYVVKEGDTLFSIAKKFKMNINDIYQLNPDLKDRPLYIGDKITVYKTSSTENSNDWEEKSEVIFQQKKYRVKKGDSLYSIAKRFNTSVEHLIQLNKLNPKNSIQPNQEILIENNKIVKSFKVRKIFIPPVEGYISSGYGYRINPFISNIKHFHKGIDIAANMGTPIKAARDGLVIFSGRLEGYGNCIFIRHQDGYITVYGHNKVNKVKVGDIVYQGQEIAEVGRTGYATGPHLHFEVRKLDQPIDPNFALKMEEKIQLSFKTIALK
jgi:murein DD-endopeptidase MepM/ murein hydrolase activator NlpD